MKHFVLYPLLAFVIISIAWHVFEFFWDLTLFPDSNKNMKLENVGSSEAERLIEEKEELQIVDVRPERSYRSGHIPGAVNVKYAGGQLDEEAAAALDPEKPVLVYCDGGFRSRMSLKSIQEAGFEEIYHLHRGILSWRVRGKKIERESDDDS